MRVPRGLARSAIGACAILWLAAVGAPLLALAARAGAAGKLLDPEILRVVGLTIAQAFVSAGISTLGGIALGLQIGARGGRVATVCETLLEMPFVIPTVVASTAWVTWLGGSGILASVGLRTEWLYSWKAVVLAHVFFNLPWVALAVSRARKEVPARLLEAASTLGAGPWSRFRWVLLPEIRWAILSAGLQSFAFCAMSFVLVLILGGGLPVQTLETALFARVRFGVLDLSGASACALWELGITLLPWIGVLFLRGREKKKGRISGSPGISRAREGGSVPMAIALFAECGIWILPVLPLIVLGLRAIEWSAIAPALLLSLKLAFVSASLALFSAVVCVFASAALAERGLALAEALFLVPGGISALVLGLGFWLAYGKWIDPFEGSFFAMAAVQATLFFPIAYRILWPFAQTVSVRKLEAALTLGASPVRAFLLVEGGRWIAPLVSAFGLCFAAAIGEVAAVSLFYSENLVPLPLLISRWMAQYRFEAAQGVSVVLVLICLGVIAALGGLRQLRASGRREGGMAGTERLGEGLGHGLR